MTDMKPCSVPHGRILAANNNKYVNIGGRRAIIHHNSWVSLVTGEEHQVGLDFDGDVATPGGEASAECQAVILELFPELA